MEPRQMVKAVAEMLNLSIEELIEAIVTVFCDKATNQEEIIDQVVHRYYDRFRGELPDYVIRYCSDRLGHMAAVA